MTMTTNKATPSTVPAVATATSSGGVVSSSAASKAFVSQIVYPKALLDLDRPAFLIGWNTEQFQCTIAGAVPFPTHSSSPSPYDDVKLQFNRTLDRALKQCYEHPRFLLNVHRKYPFRPMILGEWVPPAQNEFNKSKASRGGSSDLPESKFQLSTIWIILSNYKSSNDTISNNNNNNNNNNKDNIGNSSGNHSREQDRLQVRGIFSLGVRYETSCYLIGFDRVNTDWLESINVGDPFELTSSASIIQTSKVDIGQCWKTKTELESVVIQINASHDLLQQVFFYLSSANTSSSSSTTSSTAAAAAPDLPMVTAWRIWMYNLLERWCLWNLHTVARPVDALHRASQTLQFLLQQPMPWLTHTIASFSWQELFPTGNTLTKSKSDPVAHKLSGGTTSTMGNASRTRVVAPSSAAISSASMIATFFLRNFTVYGFSFFFCEINERLCQLQNAVHLCALFALTWNIDGIYRTKIFVRVASLTVLVAVDLLAGLWFSYWLFNNVSDVVAVLRTSIVTLKDHVLFRNLHWFINAPGGVKLNPLVTRKLSQSIIIFLNDCYSLGLQWISPEVIGVGVRAFACLGGMGLSLQLALLTDLLSLVTMPITILHIVFSFLVRHHSLLIYSLWLLFTGQKQNILRNRVDTCEYDREQLLIAMILFTIAVFVWPSLCAYYLLLVMVRVMILLLVFVPWQCVFILKEFPFVHGWIEILTIMNRVSRTFYKLFGWTWATSFVSSNWIDNNILISFLDVEVKKTTQIGSSPRLDSILFDIHDGKVSSARMLNQKLSLTFNGHKVPLQTDKWREVDDATNTRDMSTNDQFIVSSLDSSLAAELLREKVLLHDLKQKDQARGALYTVMNRDSVASEVTFPSTNVSEVTIACPQTGKILYFALVCADLLLNVVFVEQKRTQCIPNNRTEFISPQLLPPT
jgi:hypothetical protein